MGMIEFLTESLMIEGIHRPPTEEEIEATKRFLNGALTAETVVSLQAVYAPGSPLRDQVGMNVRVGSHVAPLGSPTMLNELHEVVSKGDAWTCHVAFEKLHPFMDGNGRTGRAVWAWLMAGEEPFALSFLHRFYYQTLAHQK